MNDTESRLNLLIKQFANEEGCSPSQLEQILALVKTVQQQGVPEVDDLKKRLKAIGGET